MRVTKTTEEAPAERKHWSLDQFEMMRAKDHKDKATTHFSPSPTSSSGSVLTSGVSPLTRSHIRQTFDGVSGPRTGSGSGTRIARASSIHEGHLHPNFHQLSQPEQQQQQLHSYPQHPHPAHNRKSSLPPPLITNLPALPSPVQTTASMGTATNGIPFSNVPLGLSTPYTDVFQYTTSSSSSGNYYACPWILPPIPSFTELGIRFDRSRTTSLNTIANDSNIVPIQTRNIANSGDLSTTGMRINVDGQGYHWSRKAQPTHLSEPETIPDYLPSIFDYIQSDDNEDIILWSTSHNPGPSSLPHPPTPGGSRIHPSNNSVPPSPSSTGVYPSNSQSVDQSVRRWSVGDTFKGKDKDTDNDSRTSNELGKVAVSNQSTDTLPQQKPTRRPTGISGGVSGSSDRPDPSSERKPVSTTSVTSPSQRVIMAATVEKLVEKLTSEIGMCLHLAYIFSALKILNIICSVLYYHDNRLHFLDRLFLDLPPLHHTHGTIEIAHRAVPMGTGRELATATDRACTDLCHPAALASQLLWIRLYALQGPSPDIDQELGQAQGTPIGG